VSPNSASWLRRACGLALVVASIYAAPPARAQGADAYPARPVRIIVPFAAGGGTDIAARLIAVKLHDAWQQPVVVENRPGALGTVASEYVAHQPADGLTLLLGVAGTHAIAQFANPKLGYDPVRDFAGVTMLLYSPFVWLVGPTQPYRTLKELVDRSKMRPIPFGSPGVGSLQHIYGEMINLQYGAQLQHIPYRGVAPAMEDVVGGHIPAAFGEIGSANALIQSGQLRALAITGKTRNAAAPAVPTFTEAGFPGFEVGGWFALFAPAATPKPIVDKIAAEVTRAVHSPEIETRFRDDGWEPAGGTPEEFTRFWLSTAQQLGEVIRLRNIKIE
jgi:tripartite-type tricarboxylate transporter receptor subunit TctC